MKTARTTAIALSAFILLSGTDCPAQVYKWVDENGHTHYGNDPTKTPQGSKREKVSSKGMADESYKVEEPPAPAQTEAPKTGAGKSMGVEVVGDNIEILDSPTGLARVKASLKNNFSYPVEGVRLEVIFILRNSKKTEPVVFPYSGAKPGGKLASGEIGVIDQETSYTSDGIRGYQYQVVWNFYKGPGQEGQPQSDTAPEGATGEAAAPQ